MKKLKQNPEKKIFISLSLGVVITLLTLFRSTSTIVPADLRSIKLSAKGYETSSIDRGYPAYLATIHYSTCPVNADCPIVHDLTTQQLVSYWWLAFDIIIYSAAAFLLLSVVAKRRFN